MRNGEAAEAMNPGDVPRELFVAGDWVGGRGTFEVQDPATGEAFASVADAGEDEAMRALDAAVAAQDGWRGTTPRARAELFHAAHALMLERRDLIARTMTLESGKPLSESQAEFGLSAEFFRWFAEQVAHLHGTYARASNGNYRIVTTHEPIGPCLLITPWNFPLLMIVRKAGAALAAGCTTVVKSAQETPLTAGLFVKLLQDAGFPPGTVNLIHSSSASPISKLLMADERLRKVSFTGSTRVGSTLLEQSAQNILDCSLELGGDGPFIVLDDADVAHAVDQAMICKFRNAGQACVAANRIIVDRSIEPEFTRRFVEKTKALRVGSGIEMGTEVGPMISQRQRDRVPEALNQLVEAGGRILSGGHSLNRPGHFFEPTVVRFDAPSDVMCSNELFAPVATIFAVDGAEEAISYANNTRYGLASYLFTRDLSRAMALGERLEFGMVGINRGIMADPAAPFGGTKVSGLGREAGHGGIYEFMEEKYMAVTVDDPREVAV